MNADLQKLRSTVHDVGYACFSEDAVKLDGDFTEEDLKSVMCLLEKGWTDE